MTNRGLLEVLRRRRVWIVSGVLLGLLASGLYLLTAPRAYQATAGAFFSLEYGNSASDLVQGSTYAQGQVASFALLATTPAVLEPVLQGFDLDESPQAFSRRVQASAPVDTVLVEVTVTDASPEQSARLADAVVDSLSDLVEKLAPANDDGTPTVRATTVAPAEVPSVPSSPDPLLDLAVGLLLGLLAGTGAAYARSALDNRVRDAGVLAEVTDRSVIASVGVLTDGEQHPVVVASDPHSPQAESFRQLRTNLEFLAVPTGDAPGRDGARVLMVTSSSPGEGKSTVAANLAAALAETSASVLLVDADLRRPSVARLLQVEGAVGLTTVLLGQAAAADVVQDWGQAGLQALAAGPVPPNPVELLGSPAMGWLLDQLRAEYDYVVIDTPPLLPVADAAVMTRLVDGAVLVVNAGVTRKDHLTESLGNLERVGAPVLGIVLNAVERDEDTYSYLPREHDRASANPSRPVRGVPAAPALDTVHKVKQRR